MIPRRRWHRGVFVAAGLYNIGWRLWSALDPQWLMPVTGMPLANYPAPPSIEAGLTNSRLHWYSLVEPYIKGGYTRTSASAVGTVAGAKLSIYVCSSYPGTTRAFGLNPSWSYVINSNLAPPRPQANISSSVVHLIGWSRWHSKSMASSAATPRR